MAKAKTPAKVGRPSKYTDAIVEEICERLSKGEPLAVICRDAHMPDHSTVWRWKEDDAALLQAIARAREIGFDAIAADARQTARGFGESTKDVQRDRLIIDTDLKLLAKWDPKRYGDRTVVAGDETAPILTVTRIERIIVRPGR